MLTFVVLIPLMSYPNAALRTLPDVFIAQTVTSTQTAPANMVVNPDFEVQLADGSQLGWSTYQKLNGAVLKTVSDAAIAHSGVRCVMINQTVKGQQNFASWFQDVPAQAGVTYRFAFWIKTENVKPSVGGPVGNSAFGFVTFLDREGVNIPSMGQYYQSPNVFMTHDWKRFEISFVTPDRTGYVRILLALTNAIGTVFFDSVSLVPSSFMKLSSPAWLSEAVVYEVGEWEFAQFGNGNAFRGIVSRLPELQAVGVNTLYLLPIWADQGWYSVTDFYAIYKGYGTQDDFRTLVREAHNHGMRVLVDFAGTIGVPHQATILQQHPDWAILNENNTVFYSWTWPNCDDTCLVGIDTNRPDVQDYFVQVAKYYVQMFNIDGYRCDSANASPYEMFENIRAAIQAVKPDAILIGEEPADQPIYHETALDATQWDYRFSNFALSLPNSMSASKTASWLNGEIDTYPPGALTLRYLEDHDLNYTLASKYSLAGDEALATLLFTVNGIPMISNGQEVGNQVLSVGPWAPPINWNANPDADQFQSFYTKLIHVRTDHPVLSAGAIVPVSSSDARVAAFARTMNGADPILVVINFSAKGLNATLNVTPQMVGLQKSYYLVDLLGSGTGATTAYTGVLNMSFEPYQAHVYLLAEPASVVVSYSIQGGGAPTAPMFNYVQTGVSKTYKLTLTPTILQVDLGTLWSVTPNPLKGSSGTQRWEVQDPNTLSGTASSSATLVFTFYHQYALKLSYSVAGGGSGFTAPTFTSNLYGVSVPQTLSTSAATFWFDASSPWAVSANPLTGSGSSEQWLSTQKTSGTLTGSVTLAFKYQHQYYLTMQPVNPPGTGSVSPSSKWVNAAQKVAIKAMAKTGYKLLSWTGLGAGSYSGASTSTTITMNAPITETANFGVIIIITSNPTGGGYVTVDGVPVKTPQVFVWAIGSTHTIAAVSPVGCGTGCQYLFMVWSDGGAQSHTITVPGSPMTYKATFQKQ